jgi:hypothetical protein
MGMIDKYLLKELYKLYITGKNAKEPKKRPIHISPS